MTTVTYSILMPIYNGVEFLHEAVRSVISQTYTDWELLIGINGHGDDGGAIRDAVESAALLDIKRIHVYVLDTAGKSASLNALVEKAAGSWICLLDCDDIWLPQKLQVQHTTRQIHFNDSDAVLGTMASYFGDMIGLPTLPIGRLQQNISLECNPIINSSCMIPRRWAFWDATIVCVEDYDLWLRLDLLQKIPFFNIEEVYCRHRVHSGSAFNSKQMSPDALVAKYRALVQTQCM
jgi:glycosyltransferase involved in cell wall biosynthesis